MKVIRASVMGYCMGVNRAIEKAEKALIDFPQKKVYTFGPLIHNRLALENLESKGLKVLSENQFDLLDINSVVIIRAHGISPEKLKKLENTGATVIDATCPRVLSSHKRVQSFAQRGYLIIIAGDKNHGEVSGIQGVAAQFDGAQCFVVENVSQAENLPYLDLPCVLLSQTTFSSQEYKAIEDEVRDKFDDVAVLNTICSATEERQKALEDLCSQVDVILIVGGKNSANTRRLFEIAQERCGRANFRVKKAFHIEEPADFERIRGEILKLKEEAEIAGNEGSGNKSNGDEGGGNEGGDKEGEFAAGITAGASTPEDCVSVIEEKLKNIL